MKGQPESGKILIIEDDREISNVVAMNLESIGLTADQIHQGDKGLDAARKGGYDLIILDVMLPGRDGVSVCREIRAADQSTPILFLTARAEEIDRVLGLEMGADDYLTKPFSMRELLARVKALLRRVRRNGGLPSESGGAGDAVLERGGIRLDEEKHQVRLKGELLDLTVKEFELLSLFVRNPGRAYSRSDLLNLVWGYNFQGYEHTVNTHINRLRNKIEEDPAHPRYLLTVWGIGYRFAEQPGGSP